MARAAIDTEGTSVLDAVHGYVARRGPCCQDALAEAIVGESGREPRDPAVRLVARYVLELCDLLGTDEDADTALDIAFAHAPRVAALVDGPPSPAATSTDVHGSARGCRHGSRNVAPRSVDSDGAKS